MHSDRVYQAVKASVIACEFAQGKRIYLEPIARQLGVSTTPVREALNRLAAEGLVVKAERKGFIARTLSEVKLKGYYSITRILLTHELEILKPEVSSNLPEHQPIAGALNKLTQHRPSDAKKLVARTNEIFTHIAALNENPGVINLIDAANDHLYYIRTLECQHIEDVQSELTRLCELFLAGHRKMLIAAIDTYHDRRLALLPTLLDVSRR